MVQGTASHVGKSILVAGLCRLFRQEGLRVAPFKAQNMALNSFATHDGHEIGRAQAAQAEAAGIEPTPDMNPILLKPEGNARSQVVVGGRVYATMDAAEYHRRTEELWPVVEASLQRLVAGCDIVIIEGAGSPVEMNLAAHDLVNMRVALAISAPVLLVADIDRGGVFAALLGTMALLRRAERDLVAGFVINKFRGDPDLFAPGIAFLERRLRRPVLGVVPWIEQIGIAEEDSQGLPAGSGAKGRESRGRANASDGPTADTYVAHPSLDVLVVRLPHIANFDDFDPLAARRGVVVRYVDAAADFGEPDLVILPGTKTTRADLGFLRERGLDRAIEAHAHRGGAVIGICGGYQMLGERVEDHEGIEGPPGTSRGLGLLPAVTRYESEKATVQVTGQVMTASGMLADVRGAAISAYEIHMGHTTASAAPAFVIAREDGATRAEGAMSADGTVVGTYLHGLFHNRALVESVVAWLAQRRDVSLPAATHREDPYDRLADVLRRSLNMDRLRALAGISG
ncbi:MAG: cobyric acid synthase [Chloroflexi bacterium]|nr:cobyric acid synthase [Chloroflexota bacterium]